MDSGIKSGSNPLYHGSKKCEIKNPTGFRYLYWVVLLHITNEDAKKSTDFTGFTGRTQMEENGTNPKATALADDDRQYIWHPYTQMKDYEQEDPLIIESGDGCMLRDIHGNEYLDGTSSIWVTVHGHNRKEINDAIIQQVEKISHSTLLGLSNPPAITLAKKLVEISPPGLEKVFYSDNGSTAVEIAVKMAYQYWHLQDPPQKEKRKFICLNNGYHGDTIGVVSVGGIDLFHQIFSSLLFETYRAPTYSCYHCDLQLQHPECNLACAEKMGEILQNHHQEIAGVVLEPLVQGAGGILTAPPGYLKKVREFCDKYDVFLIADEVATGFGRTGRMFACEHEGVSPDFLCIAKGLTGGYLPLAATLSTKRVYDAFLAEYKEQKTFFHGHTYTGNPVACAAALANLEIFEKERTIECLAEKTDFLRKGLERLWELPHVGDIRQCGLMAGIELVRDRETKEPYPWEEKIGVRTTTEARKYGLILRPLGAVIVLMPPLTTSLKELDFILEGVYRSIQNTFKNI